jgi:hypothetical protein
LQKIFDWFFYTIKEEIALKTIQKSLTILILLSTFLLLNCVKFKENPLDPTTPTGFLLNFIENQNNDQESNQNQNNDQGSNQNQGYTPDKILLFPTTQGGPDDNGKYQGNIKGTYNSAREAIDTICRDEFNNVIRLTYAGNYDYIEHIHGFISIDATDSISNYPNLYNVPTNAPIMGPNPNNPARLVAENWADLWTADQSQNYIQNTLQNAIGLTTYWWSGSNINGSLNSNNCNGWTSIVSGGTIQGMIGFHDYINEYWIFVGSIGSGPDCNNPNRLVCIAW